MIHCNTWSWISTNQCTSEQQLTHTPHRNVPSPIFMLHTESQLVANFLSVYCPQREHSSSEFTAWHECIVSLLYNVVTGSHFLQQMASKTGGYDCKFVEIPSNKLVCQICLHVACSPHQVTCCERVYCQACLDEHKKYSKTCPNCKRTGKNFVDKRGE